MRKHTFNVGVGKESTLTS